MRALVLLVEPDRDARKLICDTLESMNYQVLGVNTFVRATKIMRGMAFDTLIISVQSAALAELSRATEAKTIQPRIKVIAISPLPAPNHSPSSIDAFVLKPMSLRALADALVDTLKIVHRKYESNE